MLNERLGQRRNARRCDVLDRDLLQVRHLLGGLRLADDGRAVDGRLWLALAPEARAALGEASNLPATLPPALWDTAPARLRVGLPQRQLAALARRLPASPAAGDNCGALVEALAALRPREIAGRLELLGAIDGRLAAALTALEARDGKLQPTAVALAPPLRGPAARLLAFLLAGPWTKQERIAGKAVQRVSSPAFLAGTLRISVDRWLRAAMGEGVMAALLGHEPRRDRDPALLEARLLPGELPLRQVADSGVAARFGVRTLLRQLARFEALQLRAVADEPGLRVELSWTLGDGAAPGRAQRSAR